METLLNPFDFYTIPLDDWISTAINFFIENFRSLFEVIRIPISWMLEKIQWVLLSVPATFIIITVVLLAWQIAGRTIAIYSAIALNIIGLVGAWEQAMVTLSLVVTALVICIIIGIPIGVACAKNDRFERIIRPILDTMQTIPAFVYLVPAVMLFGIGDVPGVLAIIIRALPFLIQLTNLGIRQVSPEVVEAAIAFGSTPSQLLWEAQIPLAMPSILTGLNQTIMMALAMSVLTAMIGVPGLGLMVLQGVGQLNVGLAAVGGLGIVLLAIMLDRITQALGKPNLQNSWKIQGPIGFIYSKIIRETNRKNAQ